MNTRKHSKAKATAALILTTLCAIIALQNTETVEARILFMDLSMPRAFLLFGTTAIGFVSGVLTTLFLKSRESHGSGARNESSREASDDVCCEWD